MTDYFLDTVSHGSKIFWKNIFASEIESNSSVYNPALNSWYNWAWVKSAEETNSFFESVKIILEWTIEKKFNCTFGRILRASNAAFANLCYSPLNSFSGLLIILILMLGFNWALSRSSEHISIKDEIIQISKFVSWIITEIVAKIFLCICDWWCEYKIS